MCDLGEISNRKEQLFRKVDYTLATSGAAISEAEKNIETVEYESNESMRRLALLL